MKPSIAFSALPLSLSRCLAQLLSVLLLTLWLVLTPFVQAQTGAAAPTAAQREAETRTLKVGEPIERELAGGQQHAYQITLSAGQYLNVVAEQRGIDAVVVLIGPDGKQLLEVDSPNGEQGPEPLAWIAESTGVYRLEVRSLEKDAKPGRYEAKLLALRPATADDRAEIEKARALLEATQLANESRTLSNAGQYDNALPLAERALAIREKALGAEHPDTATSLNNLASLYNYKGDYAKAEPLLQSALAIREKVLGAEHPDTAPLLNNLAFLYYNKGDYAKAEPLYQRTLTICEKALGLEHPNTATSLNNLASLYDAKGDYAKAEPLYQRALAIREKVLGAEHPDTAASLNNLAALYDVNGDYAKAEPLYQSALAICEKILGAEHPATATSLNNLAALYDFRGDYAKAEPLLQRALVIREKVLGAEHPDTGASLNSLALLYDHKGDYAKAEPLYQRALAIREKAFGAEHSVVAISLNGLALLYDHKGDYAKAEPLYQRALAICEKSLGVEHPLTATSLNNLALVYNNKGDYAKAEPLYQRALAIYEKVFGAEHSETATSLNNLALLYKNKGDYAKAEPLYQRALAICEKALGAENPETATSLNNLALLYDNKGDYAKAEPLYQRSLAIREKALGGEHPYTALSLSNLALLYDHKGDVAQAVEFRSRASVIEERNISLNTRTGSERQKAAYLATITDKSEHTVSLHTRSAPNNAAARDLALTVILQRKGRALDVMTDGLAALRKRAKPEDQVLLDQLQENNAQLARLVLNGPQRITPAEHQAKIKSLEEQKEKLEADVSVRSSEFRALAVPVTIAAVQAAIPADTALVEFFGYRPFNAKAQKAEEKFGARRYVAYVLRQRGEAQWVELGEAKAIDEAVEKLRQALRNKNRADVKQLARAVDEKVMQPVRTLLGKTRRVLIAPDGALNLVPFAALVDQKGHYLVQHYEFSYLTSGRDLLRLQIKQPNKQSAMVVANPDFGESAGDGKSANRGLKYQQASQASTAESFSLADAYFPPLPGTAGEAEALKAIISDATVLTQAQATEAALKQVSSPRILHVATHGFFLEDLNTSTGDGRELKQVSLKSETPANQRIENPLLRSGLALAGANRLKSGPGNEDDGILTAQEAAGLDLWGTKLVVLSACDTGVGEVKNGEGVYGLRRALVLAGSETQVISLWPVSDKGTRDLMIEYYRRLLRGEGRSAALRAVQLQMLKAKATADEDEDRLLVAKSQREKDRILKSKTGRKSGERSAPKDYSHPYYWASFIQSGEWANLQGNR